MSYSASLEEMEACETDSFPVLGREGVSPRRTSLRRKVMLCSSAVLAFAAVGLVVRHTSSGSDRAARADDLKGVSQKATIVDLIGTLADGVVQSGKMIDQGQKSWGTLKKLAGEYNASGAGIVGQIQAAAAAMGKPLADNEKLLAKIQSLSPKKKAMLKAKLLKKLNITNGNIIPDVNTTDGNNCEPDEEEFLGLCYKKCSLLTGGTHPTRMSGASCCAGNSTLSCLGSMVTKAGACAGYSVGGDATGMGGCPHAPGSCLKDEELFGGICYIRCALATWNILPYRAGGATCCKTKSSTALDIANCHTNSRYSRGGGMGDGHKLTPGTEHAPIAALTETSS